MPAPFVELGPNPIEIAGRKFIQGAKKARKVKYAAEAAAMFKTFKNGVGKAAKYVDNLVGFSKKFSAGMKKAAEILEKAKRAARRAVGDATGSGTKALCSTRLKGAPSCKLPPRKKYVEGSTGIDVDDDPFELAKDMTEEYQGQIRYKGRS